ncbi:MAG: paaH [Nitrospira sp.]|jgi:3-hydroxybutyryl-CoA dehydrogenase|nr:paaH [Nitrospira sp.]
MTIDDIKTIGVVGAGQMGRGIAQVLATAGWNVLLVDVTEELLESAVKNIWQGVMKAVEKGALRGDQAGLAMARIQTLRQVKHLREAQMVIEAIPEDLDMKRGLFTQLGQICEPSALLASNTSSISIATLGRASGRPDRVVGIHFMNPVPAMRLVEIVRTVETSEDSVHLARDLVRRMGKTPVICKDFPGFIVNRVLIPMINEAIFALEDGVASAEAIDLAMVEGTNHPMGPLALADRIGLDTVLAICEVLRHDLDDPKFRPCPLLRKYVEAGRLGRKSGQGFYLYAARTAVNVT